MQELNEAWAVLRSPALRAAYDDEQARQAAPAPAEAVRLRSPFVDDDLVTPAAMSEPAGRDDTDQRGGCGVFLVVTAALMGVVLLIALAVAWSVSGAPESVVVRTREKYAVGTCVLVTPSEDQDAGSVAIEEVPCTGPGPRSGKVQAKVPLPLTCPRGSAAIVLPADELSLCVAKV